MGEGLPTATGLAGISFFLAIMARFLVIPATRPAGANAPHVAKESITRTPTNILAKCYGFC